MAKYINSSISFGFGYYEQTMPGYFYLTYESLPSGSQPDKIIDPEYQLKIMGGMFQVDAIKSLMKGENSPFASYFVNAANAEDGAGDFTIIHGPFARAVINF